MTTEKSKKTIDQNVDYILNNNPGFFWFIKSKGKVKLLSSGDDRETSKKDAIDKILKLSKTK